MVMILVSDQINPCPYFVELCFLLRGLICDSFWGNPLLELLGKLF